MFYVQTGVVVADEFEEIHQIVGVGLIDIGLIGGDDGQQRERQFAAYIGTRQGYIGVTEGGQVKSFEDVQVDVLIRIVTAEHFYTRDVLQGEDGILVRERNTVYPTLVEFFMRRPAYLGRELGSGNVGNGVEAVAFGLVVVNTSGRLLRPVFETETIGKMVRQLLYVIEAEDVVV